MEVQVPTMWNMENQRPKREVALPNSVDHLLVSLRLRHPELPLANMILTTTLSTGLDKWPSVKDLMNQLEQMLLALALTIKSITWLRTSPPPLLFLPAVREFRSVRPVEALVPITLVKTLAVKVLLLLRNVSSYKVTIIQLPDSTTNLTQLLRRGQ
jgi:hypothetical protein